MAVIWKKVYNFASAKPKLHQYMKQIYRHALLTLLLGATCATAGATTGDIINEDFSGFTDISYATTSKNNWTLFKCDDGGGAFPETIFFNFVDGKIRSYATTPSFSHLTETCNAVMTFKYANTSSSKNASFSVTINGDGTFPDGEKTWETTITTGSKVFNSETLKLIGVSAATSIRFKLTSTNSGYFVLDDVVISTADQVTLRDEDDIANEVTTKEADVTVGRTIQGGVWNTLCLPFDIGPKTMAQATRNAVEDVSLRTFTSYSDGAMIFESADTVSAGTPFLVKVATTSENPFFPLASLKGDAHGTLPDSQWRAEERQWRQHHTEGTARLLHRGKRCISPTAVQRRHHGNQRDRDSTDRRPMVYTRRPRTQFAAHAARYLYQGW